MADANLNTIAPAIEATKFCTGCQTTLSVSLFYKHKTNVSGLHSRCKKCHGAKTREYALANKPLYAAACLKYREANKEKVQATQKASHKKQYEADPEKFRVRSRTNYHANPEKMRAISAQYRTDHPEYTKEYLARYYEANKQAIKDAVGARVKALGTALLPLNAARQMRRVARKKQATPAWADNKAILVFYHEAARLTKETGIPHDVDHIVPLQSRLVCGLHVEHNMQVLTADVNKSKGNRHWPDQP